MSRISWADFRNKLKARAKFTVGLIVTSRGKMCRISGRYWRQDGDLMVYDLREIGPDGQYVRNHFRVVESELMAR